MCFWVLLYSFSKKENLKKSIYKLDHKIEDAFRRVSRTRCAQITRNAATTDARGVTFGV